MKRLTHLCEYGDKRKNREPMLKIRNKLFELENIEDELGIPLITLFKALKQEVIYTKYDNEPHHFMIENRFGKYLVYDKEWLIELNEYGKTWALTKEELL